MELREKIARLVYDDFGPSIDDPWDAALERRKRMGMVSGLSANQERCLNLADEILAIPAIAEALARADECPRLRVDDDDI